MPWSCFNYPADVPADTRKHGAARAAPCSLRRMPFGSCFSCPAGMSPGTTGHDTTPPVPPGLRRMPHTCFSYSPAAPMDSTNRNTTGPSGGHSGFVSSACFSYPVHACFRY